MKNPQHLSKQLESALLEGMSSLLGDLDDAILHKKLDDVEKMMIELWPHMRYMDQRGLGVMKHGFETMNSALHDPRIVLQHLGGKRQDLALIGLAA